MKLLITESQLKKIIQENLTNNNEYFDLIDVSVYFQSNPKGVKYYSKNTPVNITLGSTKQNDIININHKIRMKKDAVGDIIILKGETDNWSTMIGNFRYTSTSILKKGKVYDIIIYKNCNSLGEYVKEKNFTLVQPAMTFWGTGGNTTNVPFKEVRINGFVESQKTMNACKSVYSPLDLLKAKNWWKEQLNSVTAQRMAAVNNTTYQYINNTIFPKYKNFIDRIQYFFLSTNETGTNFSYGNSKNAWAWVFDNGKDTNIYINCANYQTENDSVATLVHEIQHQLNGIYQMTPNINVSAVVTPYSRTDVFFGWRNFIEPEGPISKEYIDSQYERVEITNQIINHWKNEISGLSDRSKKYACRETEQLSRIKSFQQRFNISSGGFTVEFFLPYINGQKHDTEMWWFLCCWALSGFKPIEELVKDLNQNIAKNISTNTSQVFSV